MKKILFYGVLLFVVSSCGGGEMMMAPAPSLPTLKVKKGDLTVSNEFAAEIQSRNVVEIRSRATGYVDKIFVAEGAQVKKGQPIVKISESEYTQRVLAAEAAFKSAKAAYDNAALEVHKLGPLVEKNIISRFQLETAESQAASAKAVLGQYEHQLQEAKINRSYTLITSPVDGVIGSYTLRVGSLLSNSELVTTVAAAGDVFAYFAFDEKKIIEMKSFFGADKNIYELIALMPKAQFIMTDGSVYGFEGVIEPASGIVNQNTGSLQLKATFANPDGELRTGSVGRIRIPVSYKDVVRLPQKATFESQNKRLVYIVSADSTIKSKAVTTTAAANGYFVVSEGVEQGDVILYEGIAQVREGAKISPRDTIPSMY